MQRLEGASCLHKRERENNTHSMHQERQGEGEGEEEKLCRCQCCACRRGVQATQLRWSGGGGRRLLDPSCLSDLLWTLISAGESVNVTVVS